MAPHVLERMQWIETALRQGGPFPREAYRKHFGITAPAVTVDLDRFAHLVNDLGGAARRHHGGIEVRRWPESGCAGTIGIVEWHGMIAGESLVDIPVRPVARPDQRLVAAICFAIRQCVVVRVKHSRAISSAPRAAHISPGSLIRMAGHLYLRAYDHDAASFATFDLACLEAPELAPAYAYVDLGQDPDWQEVVRLRIGQANAGSQAVTTPLLRFETRRALVPLELEALGIRSAQPAPTIDWELET